MFTQLNISFHESHIKSSWHAEQVYHFRNAHNFNIIREHLSAFFVRFYVLTFLTHFLIRIRIEANKYRVHLLHFYNFFYCLLDTTTANECRCGSVKGVQIMGQISVTILYWYLSHVLLEHILLLLAHIHLLCAFVQSCQRSWNFLLSSIYTSKYVENLSNLISCDKSKPNLHL